MLTTLLTRIKAHTASIEAFFVLVLLSLMTYGSAVCLHVHGWLETLALFGVFATIAAMIQALLLPIDDQPTEF